MRHKPKGFLTVVETVYHQLVDSQPHGEPRNFQVPLYTDEQPFERRVVVESPKTLAQLGCWLTEASYVTIYNEHGQRPKVNPSDAERRAVAEAVVEVMVSGIAAHIVRPGRSCRFEPIDLSELSIQCRHGSASIVIAVYPR